MNDLKGPPAELRFTVTIKRAGTGKVETYDMVGIAAPEQVAALLKEKPEAEPINETKEN
jgi:hypothetical protein